MLVYRDIGEGTPIVFIHGLGSKKEVWKPQYELANSHRLILPDLRGHGETCLDEEVSMENFALDIIHLLDHLMIPSAFICGLSLGGIVAQELYKQRPDMIKGLILCNTTSYIPSWFTYHIIHQARRLHQYDRQKLLERIAYNSLYNQSYKEETIQTFQIRDSYIECAKAPIGRNYFPILPTINRPVLLIGSTHDRVTPLFNYYWMRSLIKSSYSIVFPQTGHLSNIERKDHFNQAIIDFMTKIA